MVGVNGSESRATVAVIGAGTTENAKRVKVVADTRDGDP